MQEVIQLEAMLLEVARRLEENGRRIAAETLREAVESATAAPTAAARWRRLSDATRVAELSAAPRASVAASS